MARSRDPGDWSRDLSGARPVEQRVAAALRRHPEIRRFSDFTEETELDFQFEFERLPVRLDVKEKRSAISDDYAELWPDVDRRDLFILDETAFRKLVWADGMGYVLIHDRPGRNWHIFGPWELCLGPRRRFERRGDRGSGEFLKGKLLLDLRSAAATTPTLDVGLLLEVVRRSRRALERVGSVPLRTDHDLPVIPPRARVRTPAPAPDASPLDEPREVVPTGAVIGEPPDGRWCGLSAELAHELRRRFGWVALTPVQRLAVPQVLAGHNLLILAPTAGGKTEAALLPLLDLWRQEGWGGRGPSILAISPLRALLDDQLARWRTLGSLVGATAFAWHSDVGPDERRAFKDRPADAMLTTPESLENLLTSPSHDEQRLFGGLQVVLIDEVHAFVGGPRGAQLASLLERLDRFVDADIQRIGLSATVGNPVEVLDFVRGGSVREHRVISAESSVQGEHLELRTFGDAAEAIATVREAAAGARALVFTRSRRRAEELASGLGAPVHHSSIAAEGRSQALEALASGETRCIVATSSLEMGIDIAGLDLVVHDGAPTSPASYLQRLGRAGRRTGERRLVFTTGEADDLLLILAVLARVRRNDIDPIPPRRGARLVLGQQALAHSFQTFISDRRVLADTLLWSRTFAGLGSDIDATIDHLLEHRWLQAEGPKIVAGPEAQRRFGGTRGLSHLLATFASTALGRVVTEAGVEVGSIDWEQAVASERSATFTLAGKPWTIVRVDQAEGLVVVQPGDRGKPLSWKGPALDVGRSTWEAVREVLAGTEVPLVMDDRARAWLDRERLLWRSRLEEPVREVDGTTTIDSFGGIAVHRAVLRALELDGAADGPSLDVAAPSPEVAERARAVLDGFDAALASEAAHRAGSLPVRYPELTAPSVLVAEALEFHVDAEGIRRCLVMVTDGSWPY